MSKRERVVKAKFLEERQGNLAPLKPMNETQREYIRLLREKQMVIATGLAGTSKTYIPVRMACEDLREGAVDKIYITRPNISNSKSLGYFGGDLVEKMSNWLLPVLSVMREVMGQNVLELAIKNEQITFIPFEVIKGMSFDNAWVICDEGEDLSEEEAKKFVTRLGKNIHCVISGDVEQSELKSRSGLLKLKAVAEGRDTLSDMVGFIDFNRPNEIVRSDLCKEWVLGWRAVELEDDKQKGGKQ